MIIHKPQMKQRLPIIKVVGVGGGGINAVNHMITCGLQGVDFIVVDCNEQDLLLSKTQNRIHIGKKLTKGLGTGANPQIGQKASEEAREFLIEMLQGTDIVFIVACMGGGTGTGAAPIVAECARESGALTIGVVTIPFSFEGKRRMKQAETGIANLKDHMDTLTIIPVDIMLDVIDRRTRMTDAYHLADEMMRKAVQGISDVIVAPGLVNADVEDVKALMTHAGIALVGTGTAKGMNGAAVALKAAIKSPLLEKALEDARSMIFNITGGEDITFQDVAEAVRYIPEVEAPYRNIIFGAIKDNKLAKDEYLVTVVAAKFPDLPEFRSDSVKDESKQECPIVDSEVFTGKLQEVGILTITQPYIQCTNADYSQLLILDNKGNVFFERKPSWSSKKKQVKRMQISIEDTETIFHCISKHFKEPHACLMIPDLGYWETALKNTEGKIFKFRNIMSGILSFSGNVSSDPRMKYDSELREMTILIKDIIKDKSVIAFGGCESMERLNENTNRGLKFPKSGERLQN